MTDSYSPDFSAKARLLGKQPAGRVPARAQCARRVCPVHTAAFVQRVPSRLKLRR